MEPRRPNPSSDSPHARRGHRGRARDKQRAGEKQICGSQLRMRGGREQNRRARPNVAMRRCRKHAMGRGKRHAAASDSVAKRKRRGRTTNIVSHCLVCDSVANVATRSREQHAELWFRVRRVAKLATRSHEQHLEPWDTSSLRRCRKRCDKVARATS